MASPIGSCGRSRRFPPMWLAYRGLRLCGHDNRRCNGVRGRDGCPGDRREFSDRLLEADLRDVVSRFKDRVTSRVSYGAADKRVLKRLSQLGDVPSCSRPAISRTARVAVHAAGGSQDHGCRLDGPGICTFQPFMGTGIVGGVCRTLGPWGSRQGLL